jgi:SpoVK/Ycf46/Vps4 family AAA+-type ATPase
MALEYIDQQFRANKGVVFIIQGVFQKNDNLIAALRSWTFDTEIYENNHTIVVFTEKPDTLFDEETLKYFNYVKVPVSTEEERKEILQKIANAFGIKKINGLVNATAGLNLHEVESVALKSIYKFRELRYEALAEYKNDIIKKSGILDIEEPEHGFEAVGGYDILKRFINDNVIKILQNPRKAEKLGLRPPRGLLLFGMGGTGKTWFAKALARELKLPFLRLRTENIVSKYYGETERSMARALELAEEIAPCVLFIDEIDRFGQRGQLGEHEATRRTFSILLEWLGDARRKTIVIGT